MQYKSIVAAAAIVAALSACGSSATVHAVATHSNSSYWSAYQLGVDAVTSFNANGGIDFAGQTPDQWCRSALVPADDGGNSSGWLAGCDAAATKRAAEYAASSPSPTTPFRPETLTCTTVVDSTGYSNGPLTTDRAVGFLTAMLVIDGLGNIMGGTPSASDAQILDTMASDLRNYQGNKLSDDAAQFYSDETSYNPDNAASVDLAYAHPLVSDILALQRDCPAGTRMGIDMARNGS